MLHKRERGGFKIIFNYVKKKVKGKKYLLLKICSVYLKVILIMWEGYVRGISTEGGK